MKDVIVVTADMAIGHAEYHRRGLHDRSRRFHDGASKFFGPG
jgi:hypothetical protein